MLSANRFAFKEWAVVCAALATGRQSLILRKGGIHEGRDGFRVEHREFWLFPTRFHQEPGEIVDDAQPLWEQVRVNLPPADAVRLAEYAVVDEVIRIEDESRLVRLTGLHVWSATTLSARFHYRTPGLFALPVRVYCLPQPLELPNSPHFAGCRSWVDLPTEFSTEPLQPVLDDQRYKERLQQLRSALK